MRGHVKRGGDNERLILTAVEQGQPVERHVAARAGASFLGVIDVEPSGEAPALRLHGGIAGDVGPRRRQIEPRQREDDLRTRRLHTDEERPFLVGGTLSQLEFCE